MFLANLSSKRKSFGAVLLLGAIFLTFGHTLIPPSIIAFADDRVHVDEVPHAPDSENHSSCPTELHQKTISSRTTSDEDSEHPLGDIDHCTPVTIAPNTSYVDHHSVFTHFTVREKLPPRLPLQQKTHLLL